jgi:hypothetical protein
MHNGSIKFYSIWSVSMHTKKSALLLATAWVAAFALMPAVQNQTASGPETPLELTDVTLVIGPLPDAVPQQ